MSNETRYFGTLKAIANAESPERLRKRAQDEFGLPYEEALEMAYENLIFAAQAAIRGKRRPKETTGK